MSDLILPAPLPRPFALYSNDITVSSAAAGTAGLAFYSEYVLNAPVTVAQMRCEFSGAPTGNVDMGIYDATGTNGSPGNLLGHTGAIAAATGLYTQNLTANLNLAPGRYWLAFLDTVADTVFSRTSSIAGMGVMVKSVATGLTVLPASAGSTNDSIVRIAVMALLSGSFS